MRSGIILAWFCCSSHLQHSNSLVMTTVEKKRALADAATQFDVMKADIDVYCLSSNFRLSSEHLWVIVGVVASLIHCCYCCYACSV